VGPSADYEQLDAALRDARVRLAVLAKGGGPPEAWADRALREAGLTLTFVDDRIVDDEAGTMLAVRFELEHPQSGQNRTLELAVATSRDADARRQQQARATAHSGILAELLSVTDDKLAGQPTMPIPKIID
jgi:hypothetical protein